MKILILDDDKELLTALKDMLARRDHVIECSASAAEAAKLVEDGDYDFVLVDYKMPDNDGIWFMKNVKLPRKTKALLMTAYVNREIINKMFSLGASGYIIKPFDENELFRHLEFYS